MMTFLAEVGGTSNPDNGWGPGLIITTIVVLIVVIGFLVVVGKFIRLYVRAIFSGAAVRLVDLVGMRIRNVNSTAIVDARIQAMRAGINVSTAEMESHVLARG